MAAIVKHRKHSSYATHLLAAVAAAVTAGGGSAVHATNVTATWDGTTNNWSSASDWSTNPNYPNNGVPVGTLYDVNVASGTITLNVNPAIQTFDWSGGTLVNGTLNVVGGINFSGSGDVFLNGATLINAAGQTASFGAGGSISLFFENGGVFTNNGTLTINNGTFYNYTGSGNTFNNAGTTNVTLASNTDTFSENVALNNTGTLNVTEGILNLTGGETGSTTGSFNVSSGATLNFPSNFTLASGAEVAGAGTVDFSGGSITFDAGSVYNFTGSSEFTGGNVDFLNPVTSIAGPIYISSGTVSGTGAVDAAASISLSGGTLEGLTVNANGGINFSGSSDVFLNGATLINAASQTASFGAGGSISLFFENGGVFTNNGTLTINNGTFYNYTGSGNTFNNAGTTNVTLASNTDTFSENVALNNTGTLNVTEGILNLQGTNTNNGMYEASNGGTLNVSNLTNYSASTLTGGTYEVAANSTMILPGNVTTNAATIILNGANTTFSAISAMTSNTGTFKLENGASFTLSSNFTNTGTLSLDPSSMDIVGNLSLGSAGTLDMGLAGTHTGQFDTIDVTGLASVNGALSLSLENGFTASVGDSFIFLDATGGITGTFTNAGPYNINGYTFDLIKPTNDQLGLEVAAVPTPEPASLALLAAGGLGLLLKRGKELGVRS